MGAPSGFVAYMTDIAWAEAAPYLAEGIQSLPVMLIIIINK
jgi:hypothetical protein